MPRLKEEVGYPIDEHVGNRVRLRRTMLGLSQERLAEALGVSFQQIQKYERGGNRISAGRLYSISRVLNVPVSFFFQDVPGHKTGESAAEDDESLARRETLELVRAFYRIRDPRVRENLVAMLHALAPADQRTPVLE